MKIYSLFYLILFLASCTTTTSDEIKKKKFLQKQPWEVWVKEPVQQKTVALKDLIPSGYTIVQTKEGPDQIAGDLNGDEKVDLAVLIEMRGDESYDHSEEVLLMIYTADRHGQLQLATATENLGGASVAYDSTKKLSLQKNILSYHHQSMRHHIDVKFRYDKSTGNFMLIRKDFSDYGSIESGPRHISINYLTGTKLINESIWDEESEEAVAQPERKENVSRKLKELGTLNWEELYDDL